MDKVTVYSDVHRVVTVTPPSGEPERVEFGPNGAEVSPDTATILLDLGRLPTARPGEYYTKPALHEIRPKSPLEQPEAAPPAAPAKKVRRKRTEETTP